jgi:hypothetical protein
MQRVEFKKEKTVYASKPYKRTFIGKDVTPTNVFLTKVHSTVEEKQSYFLKSKCKEFERHALKLVDSLEGRFN